MHTGLQHRVLFMIACIPSAVPAGQTPSPTPRPSSVGASDRSSPGSLKQQPPAHEFSPGYSPTPALVAQGIEHRPPEPCAQVRILPRALPKLLVSCPFHTGPAAPSLGLSIDLSIDLFNPSRRLHRGGGVGAEVMTGHMRNRGDRRGSCWSTSVSPRTTSVNKPKARPGNRRCAPSNAATATPSTANFK